MPVRSSSPTTPLVASAVAIGGGTGAALRYELEQAIHPAANGFPVATLLINLIGSLLLGVLVVAVTEVWRPHPLLRPLLGTGVLGGFTTFSTFALETRDVGAGVVASYVAASVIGGVALAALGMSIMRRFARPGPHDVADPIDPDLP